VISTSVIVPVHNGERHLNSLLESLTKQSLSEKWETVAVDNGSSDGSVARV
jgi:glycosyltransferase involved in cell wall biosynthesis